MPLGELEGISPGCKVYTLGKNLKNWVGDELLGHIVNGLGEVIDDEKPSLSVAAIPYIMNHLIR
jgi:flagellum-specific ATP synthase